MASVQTARWSDPKLRDFWAFATTVPRSASLAAKESTRLRGAWITDQLAVQKVHGYSLSAVRIVCVVASSDEERQRLESFFARDQRNMRARFRVIEDALDQERRVLLKVPYDTSLDIIWHEYEVLQDLAGIQGIPRLYGVPFFFEDLGVNALATEFSGATSVQETLGTPVDAYRMACFLKTLQEVHARGWIHGDLQPKDLLLEPSSALASLRQSRVDQEEVAGLLCGWSRASRGAAEELDFEQLLPWLQAAPKSVPLARLRGASVFSAPEQYVSLYTGEEFETASVDLYRLGAITACALGTVQRCHARRSLATETLRRLCHRALVHGERTPEELELFLHSLKELLEPEDLTLHAGAEGLAHWLQGLLSRPGLRPRSAQEALDALQQAWASAEPSLAAARWRVETPDREPHQQSLVVLQEPKLLAGMAIV